MVVVEFYSLGDCIASQIIRDILKDANLLVPIYEIEVEKTPEKAEFAGLVAFPALIARKSNGVEQARTIGFISKDYTRKWLKQNQLV